MLFIIEKLPQFIEYYYTITINILCVIDVCFVAIDVTVCIDYDSVDVCAGFMIF